MSILIPWFVHNFLSEILSKLSSEGISPMSVDLHNGDILYIPQMWWQHVTLLSDHNLFVQFLWPSRRMQISSHIQPSFKTRGNLLQLDMFFVLKMHII